jgi:hypothetical protein
MTAEAGSSNTQNIDFQSKFGYKYMMNTLQSRIRTELMNGGKLVPKRCLQPYLERIGMWEEILEVSPDLSYMKPGDRIKSILQGIVAPPMCNNPTCNDHVKMNDGKWQPYCSVKCFKNDPKTVEKTKQTNLERYGTENTFQSKIIKEKIKASNRSKFGVDYPMQNKEILEKANTTNKDRYGVSRPLQNKEINAKAQATMRLKYGAHPMLVEEIRERIKTTNQEKYGSDWYFGSETFAEWADNNFVRHSKPENEIRDFLESLGHKFPSTRKILRGRELDGYCKELQLAFEHNGIHYHNEDMKDNNYHHSKYQDCKNLGIHLISIHEIEWYRNKDRIKHYLRSLVGDFERRIYARQCVVREIDKIEAFRFCDAYHMQGTPSHQTKYFFGLFKDDELLGVVTYAPHHRGNGSITLNRLCFKEGVQIVGGASKLVKNTITNFDKVITWSDNRWSDGSLFN